MTILEAKGLLFAFFTKKHSFHLDIDYKDIVPVTLDENLDKLVLASALEDLIKNEIVRHIGDHYVLVQPLDHYPQTISLSKLTTGALCEIMAYCSEQLKNDSLLVNPFSVSEQDIQNLIVLLQNALKK